MINISVDAGLFKTAFEDAQKTNLGLSGKSIPVAEESKEEKEEAKEETEEEEKEDKPEEKTEEKTE